MKFYPALTALLLIENLSATGIEQAYHDAVAAARGNAFAATADSPAAVHYNPAGLAWQDQAAVSGTFFGTWSESSYNGPLGNVTTSERFKNTGSLFAAIPFDRFTLGLGLTSPHGLSIDYQDTSALRSLALDAELAHLVFDAQLSGKITKQLSFGAGLAIAYDDLSLNQGLFVPGDSFGFEGDGWGLGFKAGLLWKPHEKHSFAITYRSEIDVEIDGSARTRTIVPGPSDTSVDSSTEFNHPQQWTLGYAWKPTDRWLFEVNATWTDWRSFDTFRLSLPGADLVQPYDYEPSWVIGGGVSCRLNDALTLNGGYLFGQETIPDSTFSPLVPDANLHVISAGLQYCWDTWEIAATYLYGFREDREVTGSPASPATMVTSDGQWQTDGSTVLLTLKKEF